METPSDVGRTWPRAAGLLGITLALSVASAGVLVAVPFVALAMALGSRRLPVAVASAVAVVVTLGGVTRGGLWYFERGWAVVLAGWFVVATLRWPSSRFFPRALGAVAGAFASVGVLLLLQPGSWGMADWIVTDAMMQSVSVALSVMQAFRPDSEVPVALVNTAFDMVAQQGRVFPALLGLSSLAGLGIAWWGYVRLGTGSKQGLGPLRDFRFNDHLLWLFLLGLAVIVLGLGDAWTRAGTNAVVFMGGLYALRGMAVVLFLTGGVTFFGFVLLALAMLFVAPVLIMGALVLGIGDTWLDLRKKAEAMAGPES